MNNALTEYEEQLILIQYLNLRGYRYFHVPNSTWTKSFNQKRRNKALGVMPGVPDMFIIVNNRLIAIELKRIKGSKTSTEQIEWIKTLNNCNIPARICYGAEEAINFIEEQEKQYAQSIG